MNDDLQELLQEALAKRISKDDFIQKFREALKQSGAAGLKLEDAHEYAQRRGEASSGALLDVIKPGLLPDDRMDFATANQTVRPLLEENFDDVQDAANQVQKLIDRAEGIGLNGVKADFPKDRAAGLIDKLTDSETIEELRKWLGEPIILFSAAAFDQWVQANADFRYKAGMSPKIIRKGHLGMCPWCAALVGTFDYETVRDGSDVFRRHKQCKCTVTYVNGSMRQDVWSKKTWQASPEELESRKNLHKEIVKLNPGRLLMIAKSAENGKEGLEKYSAYQYNTDGTIIVTDDWTNRESVHIPGHYKPYAVIDTVSQRGTQRDRTFFDANGWQVKQISNGPHGNPKRHDYGEHGEHAHDIIWRENNTQRRETRNLTDAERKENADIL